MGGACLKHARDDKVMQISIVYPKRKRQLGIQRHIWEDNIEMYLKYIGFEGVNWIQVAQDRMQCQKLVNTVMTLPLA
jgi:hypothetical protein